MTSRLRKQAKAIVSGALAGLGALATALADQQVTQLEWVLVAATALGAYGAVYRTSQPASLSTLPHMGSDELMELASKAAEREKQ